MSNALIIDNLFYSFSINFCVKCEFNRINDVAIELSQQYLNDGNYTKAEFTLCDSIGKKIIVATEVSRGLDLKNVKTVNARAESLPETFDYVVSRAVTSLDNFMPWVKGKYSDGILYLKGGDLAEEIASAKLRKGSVHIWPISSWTDDPFFETKQVVYSQE